MLRLTRAISWLTDLKPDALVVSGDLINDGWTEGYAEIEARLSTLNCPVLLVPGNSDDSRAMRGAFTKRFGATDDSNPMHFKAKIGGLRLVGIDSCLAGSAGGDVAPHLGWLKEALGAQGEQPTLLFSHHHFVPSGIPPMDDVMAKGATQLGELLAQRSHRPLAISSGHVHRPMSAMLAGFPAHICGSICPANPLWLGGKNVPAANEPPMIMVHHLTRAGLNSSHVAV